MGYFAMPEPDKTKIKSDFDTAIGVLTALKKKMLEGKNIDAEIAVLKDILPILTEIVESGYYKYK